MTGTHSASLSIPDPLIFIVQKKKKKKDFEMHFVVCNYFTVQMIMQCDITFYIIKRDHQFVDKENKICRVKFYLQ